MLDDYKLLSRCREKRLSWAAVDKRVYSADTKKSERMLLASFFKKTVFISSFVFCEADAQTYIEYWAQVARSTFSHTRIKYSEL